MSCPVFQKIPSDCPCILNYQDSLGNKGSVNLFGAKVIPFQDDSGGIHIFSPTGSFKGILEDCTLEDINALIGECHCDTTGSSPEDPLFVDLSASMVPCGEDVEEALPVTICNPSSISLGCDESGNIIFIDTSVSPPIVTYPDGTVYTGNIVNCEEETNQSELCLIDPDGNFVTRVTVWPTSNPLNATTFWVLSDGTVTDIEPENLIPCDAVCSPFVAEFTADDSTNTEPYNSIEILNPTCCKLNVTTSAGTFSVLPKGNSAYSMRCLEWDCTLDPEITITTDGDESCLEDVVVTIRRRK